MGTRGNICIIQKNGDSIYFYTHWQGEELPGIVRRALALGKGRWEDESYLARIIFCQMLYEEGPQFGETLKAQTGFGISTYPTDGRDRIVNVRPSDQSVFIARQKGGLGVMYSFEEFAMSGPTTFSDDF